MIKCTMNALLALAIATSGSMAWAQAKPKTAAGGSDAPLQTQRPVAPPLQTQQLPGQQAPAQVQKPATATAPAARRAEEIFLMPMPKGWKQYSLQEHYNVRVIEYAPENQPPEKSEESLRSVAFALVRDVPLDDFMALVMRVPKGECQDITATPAAKGQANGYPSILVTRFCTRNLRTDRGEITIFKLIQGRTGLYLGERTWRMKAFTLDKPPVPMKTYEQWTQYMQAVTVCETGSADRPCPNAPTK